MNDTEIAYPPEGLHLVIDTTRSERYHAPSFTVNDAQDIEWIVFRLGGNGDPASWRRAIVMACCEGLGITEAVHVHPEGVHVMELSAVPGYLISLSEGYAPFNP